MFWRFVFLKKLFLETAYSGENSSVFDSPCNHCWHTTRREQEPEIFKLPQILLILWSVAEHHSWEVWSQLAQKRRQLSFLYLQYSQFLLLYIWTNYVWTGPIAHFQMFWSFQATVSLQAKQWMWIQSHSKFCSQVILLLFYWSQWKCFNQWIICPGRSYFSVNWYETMKLENNTSWCWRSKMETPMMH